MSETESKLKAASREYVLQHYAASVSENKLKFMKGDKKATSEYIYPNQKEDAFNIMTQYYEHKRRVVSVVKKTKVGADGLMIELTKQMTTHLDDDFVVDPENVRILTGMSNASWEKDMKDKAPECFRKKIFHHGQLKRAELRGLRDALIIIDELDTGDKECQVLHNQLKESGVLNVQYMEEKNIRFLFISATMVKELYHLYQWGDLHYLHRMTIPETYIGHTEFLQRNIIREFYPLNTDENVDKWIKEDIVGYYKDSNEFRVHIVRSTLKNASYILNGCIRNGIECRNHTSSDKIEERELRRLFEEPLSRHVVLLVKGFFRRANLIPNEWKLRIGAVHELYTKEVDNNVQIQGLPGRMTGYWRDVIEKGHKTGPYRTSITAVREYEQSFLDPFGENSYQCSGFKKKKGKVTVINPTIVAAKNIEGLIPCEGPVSSNPMDDINLKKNVPIVIPMTIDEIERVHKLPTYKKRNILRDLLKQYLRENNRTTLADRLDEFDVRQITRPGTESSRKKNIDDTVNAARRNQPYCININIGYRDKNSWQGILDDRDNQVIFILYCDP
jgi:hypothetical protein